MISDNNFETFRSFLKDGGKIVHFDDGVEIRWSGLYAKTLIPPGYNGDLYHDYLMPMIRSILRNRLRVQIPEGGLAKVTKFLAFQGTIQWNENGSLIAKWDGHEYKIKPNKDALIPSICRAIDELSAGRCLYEDERHCKSCCEDTIHEQYGSGHERGDYTECLKCGYTKYGA